MTWMDEWKQRARRLKREVFVLYLAYKDPRTPWYARIVVAAVVAYALSPIDLIPDFIPILGYLDDLILLPLGVYLALRLIPENVLSENRGRASELMQQGKPVVRGGAAAIVALWLVLAGLTILLIVRVVS